MICAALRDGQAHGLGSLTWRPIASSSLRTQRAQPNRSDWNRVFLRDCSWPLPAPRFLHPSIAG